MPVKVELPMDVGELTGKKKEIETLLKSLEDEYGRAQISDQTYNEIKAKNAARIAEIDALIQKLQASGAGGGEQAAADASTQFAPGSVPFQQMSAQPIPQMSARPMLLPDLTKINSDIAEVKKKVETDVGKLNVDMERLKTLSDAQKDVRTATDEKIQRLTESIGEFRSLMFQKEGQIDKLQMNLQKINEIMNEVKPDQYSRELQRRDKQLSNDELRLEKLEKASLDLVSDVKEIKNVFKSIGSVDNLVDMSKRINEKIMKMDNMIRDVEKMYQRVEKTFVDVNKKFEEFDQYKAKELQNENLSKDLLKGIDDINLKMGKLVSEEDFMKLKMLFDSFTKDVEDVKKAVSTGLPFIGPVPEEVQKLEDEKQKVTGLIKALDDQYKQRVISEEDYKKVREANTKKMTEIDDKIRESVAKIKGIAQAQQVAQPVIQMQSVPSSPQETSEDKAAKLTDELKDLYKKGLISEKAYQKASRFLVK